MKNFKVYKSSAGSGKTFALAKIYLSLILQSSNEFYFKHLLAITFTVKAAAEMKERIIGYLSSISGINPSRKDAEIMKAEIRSYTGLSDQIIEQRSKRALNAIIHNYGEFSILTIDKFVHKLVRSFSSELGLTADFEVEIETSRLVDIVVSKLSQKIGENEGITNLLTFYAESETAEDKHWDIEEGLSKLAYELEGESFFLNEHTIQEIPFDDALSIVKDLKKEIFEFEERLSRLALKAQKVLNDNGLSIKDLKQHSVSYISKIQTKKYYSGGFITDTHLNTFNSSKPFSKASKKPDVVVTVAPELQKIIEQIATLSEHADLFKLKNAISKQLFSSALIFELQRLFFNVKAEENVQTLNDFNRLLAVKFSDEQTPFIYEKLGVKFRHVLIDEFQDTSTLQWSNLLPLVENSLAEGNTNLIVGDAKQSIYRFRGSHPEQFVALPSVPNGSSIFKSSFDDNRLSHNYRSAQKIVEFNNRYFREYANIVLGERLQGVYDNLEQEVASNQSGSVVFQLVPKGTADEQDLEFLSYMLPHLQELKHKNELGETCLLFRTNKKASAFAAHLLNEGFDVVSDESLLIDTNKEIELLLDTLRAHQFENDSFRIQKWVSSLYLIKPTLFQNGFHAFAKRIKKNKALFDEVCKKLELPMTHLQVDQGNAFQRIHTLCLVYGLDIENKFITRLLDLAWEFEQGNHFLKQGFLEYYDSRKDNISIQLPEGNNALRIMTIHKSKGLEFKNVFVILRNTTPKPTLKYAWIKDDNIHEKLSGFVLEYDTLSHTSYEVLYNEEMDKVALDNLNDTYVAFTRAKENLFVFGVDGKPQGAKTKYSFIQNWKEFDTATRSLKW